MRCRTSSLAATACASCWRHRFDVVPQVIHDPRKRRGGAGLAPPVLQAMPRSSGRPAAPAWPIAARTPLGGSPSPAQPRLSDEVEGLPELVESPERSRLHLRYAHARHQRRGDESFRPPGRRPALDSLEDPPPPRSSAAAQAGSEVRAPRSKRRAGHPCVGGDFPETHPLSRRRPARTASEAPAGSPATETVTVGRGVFTPAPARLWGRGRPTSDHRGPGGGHPVVRPRQHTLSISLQPGTVTTRMPISTRSSAAQQGHDRSISISASSSRAQPRSLRSPRRSSSVKISSLPPRRRRRRSRREPPSATSSSSD